MKKRFIKFLSGLLLGISLIESIPYNTRADDYLKTVTTQEISLAISNVFKQYNSRSFRTTGSYENIFYDLRWMVGHATWVNAMEQLEKKESDNNMELIPYPGENVVYQKGNLEERIDKINETFGTDTDMYSAVNIDKSSYQNILQSVSTYTKSYLDLLKGSGDDLEATAKEHRKELKYVYLTLMEVSKQEQLFNSYMPEIVQDVQTGQDITSEFQISYTDTLKQILENKDYEVLIDKGREMCQSDTIDSEESMVDTTAKDFLHTFADVDDVTDSSVALNGVKEVWYKIFSAGSIYEPFVSNVGDETFKKVLNIINNQSEDADSDIWKLYQSAIKYAKPLYLRKGTSDKAEILTVSKLKEAAESKSHSEVYTVDGTLTFSSDTNSYNYYTQNVNANLVADNSSSNNTETSTAKDNKDITDSETYTSAKVDFKDLCNTPILKLGITTEGGSAGKSMDSYTNVYRSLAGVLLNNIFKTYKYDSSVKDDTIYMNMFGDLFLEDGTVIMSGASNPYIYNTEGYYYLGTMSFMKSYPNIGSSKIFNVSEKDQGKYCIELKTLDDTDNDTSLDGSDYSRGHTRTIEFNYIDDVDKGGNASTKFSEITADRNIDFGGYNIGDAELVEFRERKYDRSGPLKSFVDLFGTWGDVNGVYLNKITQAESMSSTIGRAFLDSYDKADVKNLAGVACAYYHMLYENEGEMTEEVYDGIDENMIIRAIINQGSEGTSNLKYYNAKKTQDYEELVNDSLSRLTVLFKGLLKQVVSKLKSSTGAINLENSYQSFIFGKLVSYGRTYMFIILIILFVALVVKFMISKYSLAQTFLYSIIVTITCWLFINVIPIYLPTLMNSTLDVLTAYKMNDLGFVAMMMHMEDYASTYGDADNHIITPNTASINLYKLRNEELNDLVEDTGYSKKELLDGKSLIMNSEAGVYVEGNVIKASLDKLFLNNSITGTDKTVAFNKVYQLEYRKNVSSNIDYYTCYNVFLDSMVRKLNNFLTVFTSSTESIQYDDITKDSFVMSNYIKSVPFLEPDETELISELYDDETKEFAEYYIGDFSDTFGFKETIKNLPDTAKDTIWYCAMKDNGYLDNADKMEQILTKVTNNTKMFLINNFDKIQYVSDENIIKAAALYATVEFQREIGQPGNEVYPMFVNVEEFNLGDLLTTVYVNDRDQFRYNLLDIVSYVMENYGILLTIVFAISVLDSWAIINVMKLIVPFLYIVFAILLFIRFVTGTNKGALINGYIRGVVSMFIGYFLHSISMLIANSLGDNVIAILLPFVINYFVITTFANYIKTILRNPIDLGGKCSIVDMSPAIFRRLGITDSIMNFANKFLRAAHYGKAGVDAYSNYRDEHGYNYYTGQEGIINDIINEQSKTEMSRTTEINEIVGSEERERERNPEV